MVGASEVVARQHRPGAPGHHAPAGAGEDQVLGVGAGRELAADGRDDLGGERDLTDAGVALGSWLEAAPKRPAW